MREAQDSPRWVWKCAASDGLALSMPEAHPHQFETRLNAQHTTDAVVQRMDPLLTPWVASMVLSTKRTLDGFSKVSEPKLRSSTTPLRKARDARVRERPRVARVNRQGDVPFVPAMCWRRCVLSNPCVRCCAIGNDSGSIRRSTACSAISRWIALILF